MNVQSAKRVGTLTGRFVVVLLLLATAFSWFGVAVNPSVGALALALGLSTIVGMCFVVAWVIHRGRY